MILSVCLSNICNKFTRPIEERLHKCKCSMAEMSKIGQMIGQFSIVIIIK